LGPLFPFILHFAMSEFVPYLAQILIIMRRYIITLGLTLFCGVSGFAQATDLYISKQTGEHSLFTGSHSKTTDQYENGSTTVTTTGPIQWNVIPNEFSIGPNQSKTWYGTVWGDVGSGPAPGTSVPASITGTYQVTFSRPTNTNSTGHELITQNGAETVTFTVHSVKVDAVDSLSICPNTEKVMNAVGYPVGGTYSWTAGNGVTIVAGGNTNEPTIKCTAPGMSTARVTYTIGGVSYSKVVQVNCMAPSLTLSCRDTIQAGIGAQFTIRSTVKPSGSVQWSVSNGLTLNSGPYNSVAFITPNAGGWQTVTAKATTCGQTITKTIQVYVNPCLLTAPDSVMVLVNSNVTITSSANVEGTYTWTTGGGVQIDGAANQASLNLKGMAAGTTWAQVTFSNATCNQTKNVKVIVLQKPTLKLTCTYGNCSPLCKSERRILNAEGLPDGGVYSWSISGTAIGWYGAAPGNTRFPVIEAVKGGFGSVTCTYTIQGQTVSATLDVKVNDYSKVVVTAVPAATDVNEGGKVTYTAVVYDHLGVPANPQPTLHWKVVYIPIGQEANVGNWVSNDLPGGGTTQTYTWGFPQGTYPLPAGGAPYKMRAWIEASEYCTYHSGSVHINVVRN
jgi:hypothetical protein